MKTLYAIRRQVHVSDMYGIQLSPCITQLMRVTVTGGVSNPKRPLRAVWEWVCTGQRIEGKALERIMQLYPVCEFQDDNDLKTRALLRRMKKQ